MKKKSFTWPKWGGDMGGEKKTKKGSARRRQWRKGGQDRGWGTEVATWVEAHVEEKERKGKAKKLYLGGRAKRAIKGVVVGKEKQRTLVGKRGQNRGFVAIGDRKQD